MAKAPSDRPPAEAQFLARLGENLRRARTNAKLSQDALAERAGVTQSSISHIEAGHTAPSVLALYQLAQALEIKPPALLKGLRLSGLDDS